METSRGYPVAGQAGICHAHAMPLPLPLPCPAAPGQARPSMPGATGLLEVSTGVLVRMVMLCCRPAGPGKDERSGQDLTGLAQGQLAR